MNKSQSNQETVYEELEVPDSPEKVGVKACDDSRYKKYFKMLQFGVPPGAVKMKMQAEGFDGNVLKYVCSIMRGFKFTMI